jgi:hypothetical protein
MALTKVARKLPKILHFASPPCYFLLFVSGSKKITLNQVHVL